jgi:hypothetical protein
MSGDSGMPAHPPFNTIPSFSIYPTLSTLGTDSIRAELDSALVGGDLQDSDSGMAVESMKRLKEMGLWGEDAICRSSREEELVSMVCRVLPCATWSKQINLSVLGRPLSGVTVESNCFFHTT